MMSNARSLSVSIDRTPATVYEFVSNPENLPTWAAGLCKAVRKSDSGWIVETPQGPMKLRFAEHNNFGVLDHYVTVPSGSEVYVPMRVLANGSGSEVLFVLFRLPGASDQQYHEDAAMVERDLHSLKRILES